MIEKQITEINQKNVPNRWKFFSLGDITENYDAKRIPVSAKLREAMKGSYPYYGASGIIDYVNKPLFSGKYVLVGEDGANLLARTSPIAFIANGKFWVNNHAHVLTTLDNIMLEFLSYVLNSIDLSKWVTGTAQPKLNQANMNKIPIPIPPINEQKRIVAKIESIFTQIDAAKERLEVLISQTKSVSGSLSTLRNSVLKQAFEGKACTTRSL